MAAIPVGDDLAPDADLAIEAGRKLFAAECQFVAAAEIIDRLPAMGAPEIAFAGRSNVGKSSLINALTGRNTLARISKTPGRTKQLNFFSLADRLMLVDMPGYGYAEAPKTEIARWNHLIEAYLRGRANLGRVILLIDSRHGLKPNDLETMKALDEAAVSYQIVLTKIDKPTAEERAQIVAETQKAIARRPAAHPIMIETSSNDGEGIAILRAALASFALPA